MRADLKLPRNLDGMLFLADAGLDPPLLTTHRHDELELNLVVRGRFTLVVGGCRHRVARRSLLWLHPAQEHQLVDRTPDCQYFVAVFKPALVARLCRDAARAPLMAAVPPGGGLVHRVLAPTDFERLRGTMAELTEDGLDGRLLNREAGFGIRTAFAFDHPDPLRLNAGLAYLLLAAWRLHGRGDDGAVPGHLHPVVRRAILALQAAHGRLTLPELAARCDSGASHLSRLFHRETGQTLADYRNRLRLERFWDARADAATVLDAVYAAGFGSYAQFYRAFTRAHGRGPRAHERAQRAERQG